MDNGIKISHTFLPIVKCYFSFAFFQPLKNIKTLFSLRLDKNRWWAGLSLQATVVLPLTLDPIQFDFKACSLHD